MHFSFSIDNGILFHSDGKRWKGLQAIRCIIIIMLLSLIHLVTCKEGGGDENFVTIKKWHGDTFLTSML